MKVIGTSSGGNPIVELEASDAESIQKAVELLQQFPVVFSCNPPAAKDLRLKVTVNTAGLRRAVAKLKHEAGTVNKRGSAAANCLVCKKPITEARGGAKVCSDECRKKRNADDARARYHAQKKGPATPAQEKPASTVIPGQKSCLDCGEPTDNPRKIVCDGCAAKRIREHQG